jgi:tetratricopeptide (TPR) repeat protein
VFELHGDFWPAYTGLGNVYTAMGRTHEAIGAFEKALQIAPFESWAIGSLAGLYMSVSDRASADRLLERLDTHPPLRRALGHASFHLFCREFERAADYLGTVIEARQTGLAFVLFSFPMSDDFRKSPRGRAVLQKMNLADAEPAERGGEASKT